MTPPASTEPHPLRCETCEKYGEGKYADACENIPFPDHMDSADRQYIKDWIREHGCASHSARCPVVAQQAPAFLSCLNVAAKQDITNMVDFCRVCSEKEACGILNLKERLKEHDATLIAQEREKWERERAEEHRTYESCHKHFACPDGEECWYSSADYYWDCGNEAARVFEAVQKAKAQAREDVLDDILNELLAKFMVANQKGNWRPWNIQHIEGMIEVFRKEHRQRGRS